MKRADVSVGHRLAIGSIVIAILIGILGTVLLLSVARVTSLRREKIELIAPRAKLANELRTAIYQQAVAFRNYALTSSPDTLEEFRASMEQVDRGAQRMAALPLSPAGRALIEQIVPGVREHQRSFDRMLAMGEAGVDRDQLRAAEAEITAHRNALLAHVSRLAALQAQRSDEADAAIDRAVKDLRLVVIVVMVLILSASVLTATIVSRSVREPADRLVAAAEAMRSGTFEPALALEDPAGRDAGGTARHRFRDELREASHVFGLMASTLKRREERLAAHARLSGILGGSLDPSEIAAEALREVTAHLGAEIGAVYLADTEAPVLRALATRALDRNAADIGIGEGVPGQAAADRRTILVREIPADTPFRVRLGFDEAPPRCIVASPMIVKDRLVGVVVVGGLRDLEADAVRFVEGSAGQLAITLDNATAHQRVAGLATALQETNEELEVQNEELQAQSEELQAQSEELQAQSEELQTQNEELMSQSEALRAQQAALAETNAALAAAEEQKNRFLAVLGHELRNPLAAIHGAAALLDEQQHGGNGREGEIVGVVQRQTRHLTKLVDDLLDVGRITSGKVQLTRRPIDLSAVARRCVASLAGDGTGDRISVDASEPVWIDADETRIEQIVTNLVINALKYTPAGGTISLHAGRDATAAVLRVADTGIGIESELLPRIFDFFVQGDARPESSKGGLGVGLTLVRHLVELHGGSIDARSDGPGLGTTMTVRFPELAAQPMVTGAAQPTSAAGVARTIVVVEDNADVRKMMLMMLRRAGHTVSEAEDGPSGVAAVSAMMPDVAFVDLDLPGFDGCEVARQVRQDARLSRVRLIALSGYGRPEDRARALAAGFDEHLVKPVEFHRLANAMLGPAAAEALGGAERLDLRQA